MTDRGESHQSVNISVGCYTIQVTAFRVLQPVLTDCTASASHRGDVATGVIVNENAASITLRNQGGDTEIKLADIATRENTRRSLMPEGFEALGAKGLREPRPPDALPRLCSDFTATAP